MACGTPSIVRDSGGCAAIVRQTGIEIVYQTDDGLVEAIEAMSATDLERTGLAERAVDVFRSCFLPEHYVQKYLQLIEDVKRNSQ